MSHNYKDLNYFYTAGLDTFYGPVYLHTLPILVHCTFVNAFMSNTNIKPSVLGSIWS
jgi:hypothetical protein